MHASVTFESTGWCRDCTIGDISTEGVCGGGRTTRCVCGCRACAFEHHSHADGAPTTHAPPEHATPASVGEGHTCRPCGEISAAGERAPGVTGGSGNILRKRRRTPPAAATGSHGLRHCTSVSKPRGRGLITLLVLVCTQTDKRQLAPADSADTERVAGCLIAARRVVGKGRQVLGSGRRGRNNGALNRSPIVFKVNARSPCRADASSAALLASQLQVVGGCNVRGVTDHMSHARRHHTQRVCHCACMPSSVRMFRMSVVGPSDESPC